MPRLQIDFLTNLIAVMRCWGVMVGWDIMVWRCCSVSSIWRRKLTIWKC